MTALATLRLFLTHHPAPSPSNPVVVCDFCSSPDTKYVEHCFTFRVPDTDILSQGDWLSCDACHELVRMRRPGALVLYSCAILRKKFPEDMWPVMESQVRRLQDLFWQHKIETTDSETDNK